MTFEDQLSSRRLPAKIPVADTSVEEKLFVSEPTSHKNDFYSLFCVAKKKEILQRIRGTKFWAGKPLRSGLSQIKDVRVDLQDGSCLRLYTKLVHRGLLASQASKKKHTDRILSFCCSLIDRDSNKGAYNPYSERVHNPTHTSNIKHQPTSLFLLGSSTSKTRMGQLTIKKKRICSSLTTVFANMLNLCTRQSEKYKDNIRNTTSWHAWVHQRGFPKNLPIPGLIEIPRAVNVHRPTASTSIKAVSRLIVQQKKGSIQKKIHPWCLT